MDPSRGWGSYEASGRSAPGAPPTPAGSPAFFGRKPEERTPGRTGILGPAALGSQNWGMHPDPRQQSWHSRGEKYVLAGGAGQNMIGFSFPACGRGNSARRALPGESIGRKDWMLCREAPTSKAFPSGGRWAGEAGSDEGAIDSPNGAGEGKRRGDRSLLLQGKVGYRIAPSSVTFGDSFPPRGSLWVVQPYTKKRPKSGHVHGLRNSPTIETMWHDRQNERVGTSGP